MQGFSNWWIPNLYTWTVLWAVTMILPKRMSPKAKMIVYPIVCSLHGFLYGVLYAPAQALLFGLGYEGMIAWIITGFSFDILHGIGNFVSGCFILPLSRVLDKSFKNFK